MGLEMRRDEGGGRGGISNHDMILEMASCLKTLELYFCFGGGGRNRILDPINDGRWDR